MSSIKNFREKGKHLKILPKEETERVRVRRPPTEKEKRERSPRYYEEAVKKIENEAVFKVRGREYSIFILELEKDVSPSTLEKIVDSLHVEIILFLSPNQILAKCDKEAVIELRMRIESDKLPNLITKNVISIRKMDVSEKISNRLNEIILKEKKPGEPLEVLLLFMPKFTTKEFDELLGNLRSEEGIKNIIFKEYVRETWITATATVMASLLGNIADKTYIYQISEQLEIQGTDVLDMRDDINIEKKDSHDLPSACLLDTGVNEKLFGAHLLGSDSESDVRTWIDPDGHGTAVGSLIVWSESLFRGEKLTPCCNIYSYKMDPKRNFFTPILNAIQEFRNKTKIFNLSANFVNRNEYCAYLTNELDKFIQEQNVILVNSVGNIVGRNIMVGLNTWGYPEYLEKNVCFNPSDSRNIFSVGSFAYKDSSKSLAPKNQISPYCPKGKGIEIIDRRIKPDVFVKGGNLERNGNQIGMKRELAVPVMDHSGRRTYHVGTSFASPLVTSYLAELAYLYPEIENAETLKAILLSNCKIEKNGRTYRLKLEDTSTMFDSTRDLTLFSEGALPVGREYDPNLEQHLQINHLIRFFIPQEAISMKVFLVHSDNFQEGSFGNMYTYLKASIRKLGRSGRLGKKEFDPFFLNVDSPVQFFFKKFRRGYSTFWEIKIHAVSNNLPRSIERNVEIRYGIAIKILLDQRKWFINKRIRKNVADELKPYVRSIIR